MYKANTYSKKTQKQLRLTRTHKSIGKDVKIFQGLPQGNYGISLRRKNDRKSKCSIHGFLDALWLSINSPLAWSMVYMPFLIEIRLHGKF